MEKKLRIEQTESILVFVKLSVLAMFRFETLGMDSDKISKRITETQEGYGKMLVEHARIIKDELLLSLIQDSTFSSVWRTELFNVAMLNVENNPYEDPSLFDNLCNLICLGILNKFEYQTGIAIPVHKIHTA